MIQTIHLINVTKKKKKILVTAKMSLIPCKLKKMFKMRSKRFFQKH